MPTDDVTVTESASGNPSAGPAPVPLRRLSETQITGNVGLYFTCFRLSQLGWNIMPTARNARGVDVVAYRGAGVHFVGIQVKTLSQRNPVPLGTSLDKVSGDYWVVVVKAAAEKPTCYVLLPEEVKRSAHRGEKDGRVSYWLQPNAYDRDDYRERWERIG